MDINAKPKTTANNAATPARTGADPALLVGGGILALLILGGLAFALTRRRRVREEEWAYDEPVAEEYTEPTAVEHSEPLRAEESVREPMIDQEVPGVVAPAASAFSFGPREPATGEEPMIEDERLPGETWIQRAYRGPSPSNPSVSLKARLKRAAFFDKREREAAAGRAEPIDTTAGLPDALVEENEREDA